MSDFDFIIVGAGPAGAVAAYLLAKQHRRVLMIEKQSFPRYKPCGGGLPVHTLQEFPYDLKPILECCAAGGTVSFKGKTRLQRKLDGEFAWLAMRDKMDAFLLEKAKQAGVICLTGLRVTAIEEQENLVMVKTTDRSFTGQYLIGADGVNSVVARSLGLIPDRKVGVALEAEISVPEAALQRQGDYATFDFGALPGGYGWIFPKSGHLSVGVFQANGEKARQLKDDLNRFIELLPVLNPHEILHMQGHRIPLGGAETPMHTRRCLLIGDAANLADPWLGEGIYYAARSAGIAAEVLSRANENSRLDLSIYSRRIHNEIVQDFKYANRFGKIIYRFPALATRFISRSKIMQEDVFLCIRGDLSFHQLWKRIAWRFPAILIQNLLYREENLT
jgi:geranylgeranyl reductase family protein